METKVVSAQTLVWQDGQANVRQDTLVREEPLEIRVNGAPVTVVMRTPGDDIDLALGFLMTEGIVSGPTDVSSIRPCAEAEDENGESHVMKVVLQPDVPFDLARFRRNLYASSSCGLCGRASIEAVMTWAAPISSPLRAPIARIPQMLQDMRQNQAVFDQTGAVHAAAAYDLARSTFVVREDIGRHNAVDKVVGATADQDRVDSVLVVSGRVSFEIVQKALAARFPCIVAVSAPSALAVELATTSHISLVGFARGQRMTIYNDVLAG